MTRRSRILVTVLVLLLLALVTTSVALVLASSGQGPTIGGIGMIPTAHQPGGPALRPTIPGKVPAFTAQDVTDFVNTRGTDWTTPGQVTVTAVEFMTAAQAVAKTHGALVDTDASRPICLVTVRGSYTISGPPDVTGTRSNAATMSGAYLWFDAATGNLLEQNAIN
jgi:hypothetical protein